MSEFDLSNGIQNKCSQKVNLKIDDIDNIEYTNLLFFIFFLFVCCYCCNSRYNFYFYSIAIPFVALKECRSLYFIVQIIFPVGIVSLKNSDIQCERMRKMVSLYVILCCCIFVFGENITKVYLCRHDQFKLQKKIT